MLAASRPTRRTAIATLALAGIGVGCRGDAGAGSAPAPTLDRIAERYVRLTLQLGQHQPSLVERWLGPADWQPGPRRPVAEIAAEIGEARAATAEQASPTESEVRWRYLQQQLTALAVAARRLSGDSMRFVEETVATLGGDAGGMIDAPANDVSHTDAMMAAAWAELEKRLPGRAPLHERYAAFRSRHALSSAQVTRALHAAVETCRRRVLPHITLPRSETVQLETVSGLGLEGRAVYQGDYRSRVLVDTSGPIDLARLLWLIAHETYPGHHLQHVLADRDLVQAQQWQERALHPSFGRHLLCAEGAADAGAALLFQGQAFEEACEEVARAAGVERSHVGDLIAVHRAVAELDLVIAATARDYLDGELGSDAATEQLTTRALVGDAQQLLFVIERQRTRVLVYPVGRRLVTAHVFGAPEPGRWPRLASIAATMTLPVS